MLRIWAKSKYAAFGLVTHFIFDFTKKSTKRYFFKLKSTICVLSASTWWRNGIEKVRDSTFWSIGLWPEIFCQGCFIHRQDFDKNKTRKSLRCWTCLAGNSSKGLSGSARCYSWRRLCEPALFRNNSTNNPTNNLTNNMTSENQTKPIRGEIIKDAECRSQTRDRNLKTPQSRQIRLRNSV